MSEIKVPKWEMNIDLLKDYESPVVCYTREIERTIAEQTDDQITYEIKTQLCVDVAKEELLKALNYDRDSYSKGYKNGYKKARADAEHEYNDKLISLINNSKFIDNYGDMIYGMDLAIEFGLLEQVEKRMEQLKEQNE